MKWIYITIESCHVRMEEGYVESIAGGDPAVGGPFRVSLFLPDKRVVSYSGKIVGIKDNVLIFTDLA